MIDARRAHAMAAHREEDVVFPAWPLPDGLGSAGVVDDAGTVGEMSVAATGVCIPSIAAWY
jgi:hypothetical protein